MRTQLALIERTGPDFRLDERTKELGRRGVAAARAVLEQVERERDAERDLARDRRDRGRRSAADAGRDAMDTAERTPAA